MINHGMLGNVAAERSRELRLQAEDFRQAKMARPDRVKGRPGTRPRMSWWRRGISRPRSLEPAMDTGWDPRPV